MLNRPEDIKAVVDAIMEEATVWAAGLDRRSLGCFATDERWLVYYYAEHDLLDKRKERYPTRGALGKVIFARYFELLETTPLDSTESEAEVYFWLELQGRGSDTTFTAEIFERIDFLYEVWNITHDNLAAVPYVEAGLRDTAYIELAISKQLDPAMAVSLST